MEEKIEVVIKIRENEYNNLIERAHENIHALSQVDKMIFYGTSLPKGHGRLKDIDKIENLLDLDKPNNIIAENIKKIIDTVPTLIGAES